MPDVKDQIELVPPEELIPYKDNPKKHPESQLKALAEQIRRYDWDVPIVADMEGVIVKGHARREVAIKYLELDKVPVIFREYESEEAKRAARIGDNKTAESSWETEKLQLEIKELRDQGVEVEEATGFNEDKLIELDIKDEEDKTKAEKYTDKIESPQYEPTQDKQPDIDDLIDVQKYTQLVGKIESSDLPKEEKDFLKLAAYRHLKFDYEQIAEYYAHASPETQELMEDLALVIIDFDKAIEQGFTEFNENVLKEG